MEIDASLIKKIVEMVLSELGGRPEYPPLSEAELKKWGEISKQIHAPKSAAVSSVSVPDSVSLTESEIKKWNEISASLYKAGGGNTPSSEKAMFHRTYG